MCKEMIIIKKNNYLKLNNRISQEYLQSFFLLHTNI